MQRNQKGDRHVRCVLPKLQPLFDAVGCVDLPANAHISLPDGFARVVSSQMISTKAAGSIQAKLQAAVAESGMSDICALPRETLRECGLSGSKIRTLKEFYLLYVEQPDRFEGWRELPFEVLHAEVDSLWGVSTWTAEMLAIFYFGNDDVFPTKDFAINRTVALVEKHLDSRFDPNVAQPHRTYLARCFWESISSGFWDAYVAT